MSEKIFLGPRKKVASRNSNFSQAIYGGDHFDMDQAFNCAPSWN